MKKMFYGLLQLAGVGLVTVGVALWSPPAALVVAGVGCVAIGEVRG